MSWRKDFDRIVMDQRPFEWGEWDCFLRTAEAVKVKSGVDIAADVRGRYSDMHGALRVLREMGCETPADLVALYLPEIGPFEAMDGDVAEIVSDDALGCLGLVGRGRVYALRPEGPVTLPVIPYARRAFRA